MERSKATGLRDLLMAATILLAVAALFAVVIAKPGWFGNATGVSQEAQDEPDDEDSVPSKQIQQYVAVYRAMQRDHSLTVEQACGREGLTVPAFRDIERKIERNDQIRNQVRGELQAKGAPAASPSP
jgi:hypothetical protein